MPSVPATATRAMRITHRSDGGRHMGLRRRDPPRVLRPRLLQLALDEGQTPLEVLLLLFKALNLTAQPPDLAVPSRLVVGLVDERCGTAQHCATAHLDLLVGRPVLLARRRRIAGPSARAGPRGPS